MFSAARAEKFNFSLLRGLRGSHFLHTAQAVRLTFFSAARACEAIVSGSHFLISLLTSAAAGLRRRLTFFVSALCGIRAARLKI